MKLIWDKIGDHIYENGASHGVLYVKNNSGYGPGVAWNGLVGVTESPTGAEASKIYADNKQYLSLYSVEEYGATIEAFTYPDEFAECNGEAYIALGTKAAQQMRKSFGFSYQTIIGNDIQGDDFAYKIHLVYGCRSGATEKAHQTKSDSPEPVNFSWEITSMPEAVTGLNNVSHIWINSNEADPEKLRILEDILYGNELTKPRLPLPEEVIAIMGEYVPPEEDPDEFYFGFLPILDRRTF